MKHEITRQNENFSNLYWLTGLKKPNLPLEHHIQYIQVKDGFMASTDGSQIREIKIDLPDGFYSVLSRNMKTVSVFKEMELVSTMYPEYKNILEQNGNIGIKGHDDPIEHGLSDAIRAMKMNTFNPMLYLDMFKGMFFYTVTVDPEGNRAAIFTGKDAIAALMPYRREL